MTYYMLQNIHSEGLIKYGKENNVEHVIVCMEKLEPGAQVMKLFRKGHNRHCCHIIIIV